MKILVVYDCLFPHTIGGAERWYRNLAERLAGEGHDVTYLTLRQWERGRLDLDTGMAWPRTVRRNQSGDDRLRRGGDTAGPAR